MSVHDLEEDYEAIYTSGSRPDPLSQRYIPVGLCNKYMCSYVEMQEREKHRRLNKYEIESGTNPPRVAFHLAVTEYKRSSAGSELVSAMDLRPWSILKRTLHYLLLNISLRTDDDWMFICDFVFNRLRAIRQDMVIQRIEGLRYIEVLEGSIRFLVFSMYKLSCTLGDYTRTEDRIITLTGPVSNLNNYELNVIREMKLTMKSLRDCLLSLIGQYEENVPNSPNRPLFEAVNLIVNLPSIHGSVYTATKYQSDSNFRTSDRTFQLIFEMYLEHMVGNHLSALKHLPKLIEHPLLILAYAPAIAELQVQMVQMLRKLYSCPGSNKASINHLCSLICPNWLEADEEERQMFGRFIATQFRFYDPKSRCCEFKIDRLSEVTTSTSLGDGHSIISKETDNETRIYAFKLLFGKEWSLYQDVLQLHGLEHVLDPTQHII